MENQSQTKIAPVVTGKVTVKQKPWYQRAVEMVFAQTDPGTVGSYVIKDIIIPKLRNTIMDMVTSATEMFLYGGNAPTNKSQSRSGYTPYNSSYSFKQQPQTPRVSTVTGLDIFQFEKIMFQSKLDAMTVLDRMFELLDKYNLVTVAQFYALANYNVDNVQANKFGWMDLSTAEVVRDFNGEFYIKLPKASPID